MPRILDIIQDKHEDLFYEDKRAMKLSHYVMAERCLQAEIKGIFTDYGPVSYTHLTLPTKRIV